jgi:hypothetical protein
MSLKQAPHSSLSYPYAGPTDFADAQACIPSLAIARWENEGGASGRAKYDEAASWFVPQSSARV